MNRSTRKLLSLTTFVALIASPALAQGPVAPKALVLTAENLMSSDSQHKAAASRGRNPNELMPGDVVRYRLTFTNVTDRAVKSVVFDNPLPAGLRYQPGTASSDREQVAISYSIDGGKSYSAQPTIEVEVEGKRVQRPAPAEMYSHIRWSVQGSVLPGAAVHAEFRAQLAPRSTSATAK
ncbi:MAG TPA: hypothetical protein VNO75_05610 [Gemmatimonadaceae bacterium]|nr:hypothetical protein [Gemmatimonadaceae bacterium]